MEYHIKAGLLMKDLVEYCFKIQKKIPRGMGIVSFPNFPNPDLLCSFASFS